MKLAKAERRELSRRTRKTTERIREKVTWEKLALKAGASLGAAAVAITDALGPEKAGATVKVGPLPLGLIAGPPVLVVGALLDGVVGGGVAGIGLGASCAGEYRALFDLLVKDRREREKKAAAN